MSQQKIIITYSLLTVAVILLKNLIPGVWVMPFAALPVLFLIQTYHKKDWVQGNRIKKFSAIFLITYTTGFALIVTEPNFYGVYFGMISFLIGKFFFLQLLRWTHGYFAISKWRNIFRITYIGTGFLLFFHYFLLDRVDSFYLYPIFIYLAVDTVLLYALFPIFENETSKKWLALWTILVYVGSDFVCAFYLLIHWINDNYTSTLLIGYLSAYLCIRYLYQTRWN